MFLSIRYLMQYPLKPVFSEYPEVQSAKMRPKHRRFEIDIATDVGSSGRSKFETTTLCSTKIEQQSCMGVGVVRNGEFHISPIATTIQMRPSFENLQTREIVQDASSEEEDDGEEEAVPLQQVHLRRKESDRAESSRVQSFSFLQSQEEAEMWVPLRVYDPGSCHVSRCSSACLALTFYYIFRFSRVPRCVQRPLLC